MKRLEFESWSLRNVRNNPFFDSTMNFFSFSRRRASNRPVFHFPWVFLVFNLGLCAVLFWNVLFGSQQFCFRDEAHYYYPVYHYIQLELEAGRFPLWTPYENIGQPFFANAALGILYPGKLIFFLPFEYSILYNFFIVGHIFLASLTLYRLARYWQISPWGATLGSLAYGFAGSVFGQYCNPIFLIGAAWVPEAILWADRTLTHRSRSCAFICAAVLSMMLLGGDPQAAFHVGLIASLSALFRWRRERILLRTVGPIRRDMPSKTLFSIQMLSDLSRNRFVLLGIIAGAAFLFSAVQVLPSSEFSKYCDRAGYKNPRSIWEIPAFLLAAEKDLAKDEILFDDTAFSVRKYADVGRLSRPQRIFNGIFLKGNIDTHQVNSYNFSTHPAQFLSFFWPRINGKNFPQNTSWCGHVFHYQKSADWHFTLYAGIIPFLLALLSLQFRFLSQNNIRIVWLSWVLLIALLGSMGYYGLGWLLTYCLGWEQNPLPCPIGGVYWLMQVLVPGYIQFRYSPKLLTLAACPAAVLAAYGFDRFVLILTQKQNSEYRLLLLKRICICIIIVSIILLLPASMQSEWNNIAAKILPGENSGPFEPYLAQQEVVNSLIQTAAVLFVVLFLIRLRKRFSISVFLLLFLSVIVIDLYFSCNTMLYTADRQILNRNQPSFLNSFENREQIMPTRLVLRVSAPTSWLIESSPKRLLEFRMRERQLMQILFQYDAPRNEFDNLPVAKASEAGTMRPYSYAWWVSQNIRNDYRFENNLMLIGVEYVLMDITKPLDPNLATMLICPGEPNTPADWAENVVLWKLKNPRDRTWIEGGNRKKQSEFSRITHYEPNRVVIESKLMEPGTVVLSDQFWPGWRLNVETLSNDGKQVISSATGTIRPINEFFRGADLSAGHYRLIYDYEPDSFRYGAILSGISWITFLILIIFTELKVKLKTRYSISPSTN